MWSEARLAFDRDKTLQVAQKYIEKRKYDRAIGEYQKVVQHDPNDARTLLRIGDLQSRLQSFSEAISSYDRVARFYAGRGFSLKAIAVLKQIREMIDVHAPHLADQYSHISPKLAHIYADLGLLTDALATYEGAARRLQAAGRDRDVVDIFRRMLALDQSNPMPYLRLAEALCRVGRLDEAIEHFWSAAQQLTQLNRAEDALKVIERILHFRQDVRVCRVAAELYLARGTREAALLALSRLQACFEADPKDLDTLLLLAKAFELLEQSSKSIEVYKEMARLAADTGREELHERYLTHLLRVAPQDSEVQAFAAANKTRGPSSLPATFGERVSSIPSLVSEVSRDSVPSPGAPGSEQEAGPESLPLDAIEFLDDDDDVQELDADEPETAITAALAPPVSQEELEEITRQALVDADSFRGLGLFDKAEVALQKALTRGCDSVEIRSALRGVLEDSGDLAGAIEQMYAAAQLHDAAGSRAAAVTELRRLLAVNSRHAQGLALLRKWVNEGNTASNFQAANSQASVSAMGQAGEHEAFELRPRVVPSGAPATSGRAPLPSYTLEYDELDADDVDSVSPDSVSPESIAPESIAAESIAAESIALESIREEDLASGGSAPQAASHSKVESLDSEMSDAVTQVPPPRSTSAGVPPRLIMAADPPLPQFTLEELHVSPSPPSVAGGDYAPDSAAPIPLSLQPGSVPSGPVSSAVFSASAGPLSRGVLPAPAIENVPPGSPPPSREPAGLTGRGSSLPAGGQARRESIRAALDEVEFFSSRGLYQDASMILRERLMHYPGEPGLMDALKALESQFQEQVAARAPEPVAVQPPGEIAAAPGLEPQAPSSLRARFTTDGTVEAGPVLDVEDELDIVAALEQVPAKEVDIDEVFAMFKQGVKDQIDDNDSATHYDLGVAYKEMGLLSDAAQEFEMASRDPKRECNSLAMMGMMYRESNELDRAAEAYVRALNAGQKTVSQEVSLYYELGCVFQDKQDLEEATYYFQRITRRESNYRDVAGRLAQLAALLPSVSTPPPALE